MDIISYILSKKYTDKSLVGAGALKGANCTIQSIEPISGGHRITFKWILNDDTVETDTMDVMDGNDGLGIKSIDINSNNHLIVTYDDNTTYDAGEIESGGSTVTYTQTLQRGIKIGEITIDGTKTNILAPSGGSGGSSALSELADVDLSTLSDGDVLVYDDTSDKWINESPEDGALVEAVLSKSVMPTASAEYDGIPVLYIGSTSASYTKGHTYVCEASDGTYSWTDVTPSGGSADQGIVFGFFDGETKKFYADGRHTIEITPDPNTLYVSYELATPVMYGYGQSQEEWTRLPIYNSVQTDYGVTLKSFQLLNCPIKVFQYTGEQEYEGMIPGYFYKVEPAVVTEEMWESGLYINPRASQFSEYDSEKQWYSLTADTTRVSGKTYYYTKVTQLDVQPRGSTFAQFEVTTSGWTADTTSQSGSTLYKKVIPVTSVSSTFGVVSIGSTGTLPTVAQQTAFDLVQYVTIDSTVPCLYLYASDIPTDSFYIKVEGVTKEAVTNYLTVKQGAISYQTGQPTESTTSVYIEDYIPVTNNVFHILNAADNNINCVLRSYNNSNGFLGAVSAPSTSSAGIYFVTGNDKGVGVSNDITLGRNNSNATKIRIEFRYADSAPITPSDLEGRIITVDGISYKLKVEGA